METRVLVVTHAKAARSRRRRPVIKLTGDWLDEIGFTYGQLVAAAYEPGKITLRLQDSGDYKDLVKEAFKAGSGLFQVRRESKNKKHYSQINLKGFWLETFGFVVGSVIAIRYEFGLIKILLVDLEKLEG